MNRYLLIIVVFLLVTNGYSQRVVRSVNSAWHFTLDNNPGDTAVVNIPHTWNDKDAFRQKNYYRGIGTYLKTLFIPQDWKSGEIFLKFEGANQLAKLWVNDQYVGEHGGGYTAFVFDVTRYIIPGRENSIRVSCDNRHNPDIPPLEADFNFYGGIYRDVFLVYTNKVHFALANEAAGNILFHTSGVSEQKADLSINGEVVNNAIKTSDIVIEALITDPEGTLVNTLREQTSVMSASKQSFSLNYTMESPFLWSPATPQLYRAEMRILDKRSGEILDVFHTEFGIRWFHADAEEGFFLNGEPIKLIGVNRHQDYAGLGNALPDALHDKDYKMIRQMGSNFVRMAHYPQDPETYRLCDELGMLVWSEIPLINEVTGSVAFTEACLRMQREQVLQHYNHPAVVFWGYMNEIFIRMVFNRRMTGEERERNIEWSVNLARLLEKETKDLDPDRLTVMALHNNQIYNTTGIADIPDVIGWNLYFGWYDKTLDDLGEFLDDQHERYPDRPILISEYGPGSDIRIQTETPLPWDFSEAYQLQSHQSYYRQVMERPYVMGMAAWNFADFGSSGRQDTRPFINQKGLVDFDRTPKDVYYYYKALLLEEPFVYIAGAHWEERTIYSQNGKPDTTVVHVFSNADSLNVTINDSSVGYFTPDAGMIRVPLTLGEGTYLVQAIAPGASHSRVIEINDRSGVFPDLEIRPLTVNVGTHCDFTDPVTGETWVADRPYSDGGWGYIGGNIYQQSKQKFQGSPANILGTDNDPLFQTLREGLSEYRFDVPKGEYRVTMLFTEPDMRANEETIYNLALTDTLPEKGLRIFSVRINGQTVVHELNLARQYGKVRAVELSAELFTERDIVLEFQKIAGKPVLSGIKLEKQ